jgi:hypothetical protein
MSTKATKVSIPKDVSKYDSSDGYIELEFGELRLSYNPAAYAGIRIEQIEFDKHGKQITRKLNLSHNQVKKLKKELRFLYPRD